MPKQTTSQMPLSGRPSTLRAIEFETAQWVLRVPQNVEADHLLDPKFWALCARQMRPGQLIYAFHASDEWFAQLYVLDANVSGARVAVLNHVDLTKARTSPEMGVDGEAYRVDYGGPHVKHRVIRSSDGMEIASGLSKAKAEAMVADRVLVDAR